MREKYSKYPHVVKFSGGRSSGMMLMKLLEEKKLIPERGDVVIFNNTSAEHPETYKFVSKVKKYTESKGVPFFCIEFQTYEDSGDYQWIRKPTYKLVNDRQYSKKNTNGFHYKGEVFEEMISWRCFLPSRMQRVCTIAMKIFTTNAFLANWFGRKEGIERLGHNYKEAQVADTDIVNTHLSANGTTPKDILLGKKAYMRSRPWVRPRQYWKDFSDAYIPFVNKEHNDSILGDVVCLYGPSAIDYVSYIGIRKDEAQRMSTIQSRIDAAILDEANSGNITFNYFTQPPNELICAPLVEKNITQEEVINFWKEQQFDLGVENDLHLSNCVYCPLKGLARLRTILQSEMVSKGRKKRGFFETPASIEWWKKIERKYIRDLEAENRVIKSKAPIKYMGFFGTSTDLTYNNLHNNLDAKGKASSSEQADVQFAVPCDCTD